MQKFKFFYEPAKGGSLVKMEEQVNEWIEESGAMVVQSQLIFSDESSVRTIPVAGFTLMVRYEEKPKEASSRARPDVKATVSGAIEARPR